MSYNWEKVKRETERLEKFLDEISQLSAKHNIVLSINSFSIYNEKVEPKRPCAYQFQVVAKENNPKEMIIDGGNTKISWFWDIDL